MTTTTTTAAAATAAAAAAEGGPVIGAKKSASASVPVLPNNSKLTFGVIAGKGATRHNVTIHTILTKTWVSPNLMVSLDIPFEGSPQARVALGAYTAYAFCKASSRLFHLKEYGVYNPRMNKDGIRDITVVAPPSEDGAPTYAKVQIEVKPPRVGQLLAALLAKVCFTPPASDLNLHELSPLGKDVDVLKWVAGKFTGLILGGDWTGAIVGGKKGSVKENIAMKFTEAFSKKIGKVDVPKAAGGAMPKSETAAASLAPVATYSCPSALAALAMAHPISGHKIPNVEGKKLSVELDSEDGRKEMERNVKVSLRNANLVASTLIWYQRRGAKDTIGNIGSAMAAGALCIGLPLSIALTLLSTSASFDASDVGETVSKIVRT
jgi:hypothetical protein